MRAHAARLLGRTGPGSKDALLDLARGREPQAVRAGALRGLAELGSAEAVRGLLTLAEKASYDLRSSALDAIGAVDSVGALKVLTVAVADERRPAEVRAAACGALGRSEAEAAVPSLIAVLEDPVSPSRVRVAAVRALSRLGGAQARPALQRAAHDPDPAVARAAKRCGRR